MKRSNRHDKSRKAPILSDSGAISPSQQLITEIVAHGACDYWERRFFSQNQGFRKKENKATTEFLKIANKRLQNLKKHQSKTPTYSRFFEIGFIQEQVGFFSWLKDYFSKELNHRADAPNTIFKAHLYMFYIYCRDARCQHLMAHAYDLLTSKVDEMQSNLKMDLKSIVSAIAKPSSLSADQVASIIEKRYDQSIPSEIPLGIYRSTPSARSMPSWFSDVGKDLRLYLKDVLGSSKLSELENDNVPKWLCDAINKRLWGQNLLNRLLLDVQGSFIASYTDASRVKTND